ncbi:MAG: type 1 glutamine amidotransferase [Pseudomonadota bacterium]
MRIGVLQTGKVNDKLRNAYGEYPAMMEALFDEAAPDFAFEHFAVVDGAFPASAEVCDGWLVTGSRHGVYDDLPWIDTLKMFLREARSARRPILGICFGHQIVAEAFGGRAVKSDRGWGLGLTEYRVTRRPGWMAEAPLTMTLNAIHQDQVVALPADATILAESDHCAFAMLAYGEPDAPDAVTIQPHPECAPVYTSDLAAILGADGRAPAEVAEAARAATGRDRALTPSARAFATCAATFLRQARARAEAA